MSKMISKQEWSTMKTDAGSDDLIRDKWHIGKHIEEYRQISGTDYPKLLEALGEIKRKFGEYKKELVSKDKKKVCADFAKEIDTVIKGVDAEVTEIEKRQKVATGSLDALIEDCEEHLELRKRVLPLVQGVEKKMIDFLDEMKVGTSAAQKGADQAKQSKAESALQENMMALQLANNGADQTRKAYEKALKLEKDDITNPGGDVIGSRLDGPIGTHGPKLDPEYVKNYKAESGKHFAEATKVTVRINGLLQEMKVLAGQADLALEEAEANTMGPVDSKRIEKLVLSVKESVEKTQAIIDNAIEKMDGTVKLLRDTVKMTVSNEEKVSKLKLLYEKQFLPRMELIKGRQSEITNALKRIKLVPEDVESRLKKPREEAVEATKKLGLSYKTLLETAANVDRALKAAIQQLSA